MTETQPYPFPNPPRAGAEVGAGPGHQLAPEVFLKPVLAELGAVLPTRALYVLDSAYDDPAAYESWLASARPRIRSTVGAA